MDKKTKPTSIRLSEEGKQLRKLLAKLFGLSEEEQYTDLPVETALAGHQSTS